VGSFTEGIISAGGGSSPNSTNLGNVRSPDVLYEREPAAILHKKKKKKRKREASFSPGENASVKRGRNGGGI